MTESSISTSEDLSAGNPSTTYSHSEVARKKDEGFLHEQVSKGVTFDRLLTSKD